MILKSHKTKHLRVVAHFRNVHGHARTVLLFGVYAGASTHLDLTTSRASDGAELRHTSHTVTRMDVVPPIIWQMDADNFLARKSLDTGWTNVTPGEEIRIRTGGFGQGSTAAGVLAIAWLTGELDSIIVMETETLAP